MSVFKEPTSLMPEFEDIDLLSESYQKTQDQNDTKNNLLKKKVAPLKQKCFNLRPKCKSYSCKNTGSKTDSSIYLTKCTPIGTEHELFLKPTTTAPNVATVKVEIHEHKIKQTNRKRNVLPEDLDQITLA